jgi:competence/damage-inducible protein CinA-like protein
MRASERDPHVVLLSVGDELLEGRVRDTNSQWLIDQLTNGGWRVQRVEVVADELSALRDAMDRALDSAPFVLVGGGLGPTPDDLTRDALAALVGEEMLCDEEVVEGIRARFARRGRTMPDTNRRQAMRCRTASLVDNPVGTAPGLWQPVAQRGVVVLLPGVPAELKRMFEESVLPRLREYSPPRALHVATLHTAGLSESKAAEIVEAALSDVNADGFQLAFYVARFGVDVVLRSDDASVVDRFAGLLRDALGESCFGRGEGGVTDLVVATLRARGESVAVAESCTGGQLASALTDVPGCSDVFRGGVVTYANEVKVAALGVDPELIEAHGAVSEEVARAMAMGVRDALSADWGLSATGVAGPAGGTEDKPVGTVWIAVAGPDGCDAWRLGLGGDRGVIQRWAVATVLDRLRRAMG